MEYSELNFMLSGLEIDENTPINTEPETDEEIVKQKAETNNLLCFRDMVHKKNTNFKTDTFREKTEGNSDITTKINNDLNNRMFDLSSGTKPKPIMEFYPRSSRIESKKDQ